VASHSTPLSPDLEAPLALAGWLPFAAGIVIISIKSKGSTRLKPSPALRHYLALLRTRRGRQRRSARAVGTDQPRGVHGLAKATDAGPHYITPILVVLGWPAFGPRPRFTWMLLAYGTIYPALWLIHTLIRGAIVHRCPYPFIDVDSHGYATVMVNVLIMTALMIGLSAVMIALDRKLPAAPNWTVSGTCLPAATRQNAPTSPQCAARAQFGWKRAASMPSRMTCDYSPSTSGYALRIIRPPCPGAGSSNHLHSSVVALR
jgi:hypothetical protein